MNTKNLRSLVIICVIGFAAGCVPDRYQWSSDGKWMTVLGDQGLRICDADGKLAPFNLPDAQVASWFPDGRRLLVSRQFSLGTWAQLTAVLSAPDVKKVTDAAQQIRAAALQYKWDGDGGPNWDRFMNDFQTSETEPGELNGIFDELGGAVAVYLREHDDGGQLKQTLPPQRWSELAKLDQTLYALDVLGMDSTGNVSISKVLSNGVVHQPRELRVAPSGNAALVVEAGGKGSQSVDELWLISTDVGRPPVQLSSRTAWYPDWSADGQYAVYSEAAHGEGGDNWLGSINRVRVAASDGKLLDKPGGPEQLVGLIGNEFARVRCLKDGRIIFDCVEENLPATPSDVPQRGGLFVVWPGKQATVSRLLTQQAASEVGDCPQFFEVSPDEKFISIPDQTGTVSVVEIGDSTVTEAQPTALPKPPQGDLALQTIPQWRNDDELTFLAPGADGRVQVMLWSASTKTATPLSDTWPASILPETQSPPGTSATKKAGD